MLAQAEATGARILAEGVESEEHMAVALATSASLGQGWYFGRPQPAFATLDAPEAPLEFSGGPVWSASGRPSSWSPTPIGRPLLPSGSCMTEVVPAPAGEPLVS